MQEQRFALLDRAVGETNVAELSQLVKDPALRTEVKASGYDLLITAINNRSYETVKVLLDAGADANEATPSLKTPVMEASVLGQPHIVELLLTRSGGQS